MISTENARELRDLKIGWTPQPGDQFLIEVPQLRDEVFTLSTMVIEAREYPTGTVFQFNGTTEWALDSVAQEDTLWLPREDQLRALLAGAFVRLEHDEGQFRVTIEIAGAQHVRSAEDPSDAYANALIELVKYARS